jgi:ATP-dependent DNA ligase
MRIGSFNLPFFPMRPTHGAGLRDAQQAVEIHLMTDKWVVQPKLNGDRACLGVHKGEILVQNRHGSFYKFKVLNTEIFLELQNSLFDGEVYGKTFYPFECLVLEGEDLSVFGPERRAKVAKDACRKLGLEYIYSTPAPDFLSKLKANLPKWEGVVLKKIGSPYIALSSDGKESPTWFKRKW